MRLCIVPNQAQGTGGPTSFQRKLVAGLAKRGVTVDFDLRSSRADTVLVINGLRQIDQLLQARRRGKRIVQRLGGPNWVHRHVNFGARSYTLAEMRNLLMRFIRAQAADAVIYQSHFVETWWNEAYGVAPSPIHIIYNGVDLTLFTPQGEASQPTAPISILSVEGSQWDKNSVAVELADLLNGAGHSAEVHLFGKPFPGMVEHLAQFPFVRFHGHTPNAKLPFYYRGATFAVLSDVIAACPNSAIEALACGTPLLGYRAGVSPDMVTEEAGRLVECHGDPWKMEPLGNHAGLMAAAIEIVTQRERFGRAARQLAEARYDAERMVDAYYAVLFG